jgi:cell shape-determining protein MreD
MLRLFKQLLIFFAILYLHFFVSSLLPPFNLLEIINITLLLALVFWGFDKTVLLAILLGLFKDYGQGLNLGISSLIYLAALATAQLVRNTLLTHQNFVSVFLLSLLFNFIYFLSFILRELEFNLIIIQELVVSLIINASLTFLIFFFIKWAQEQFRKRFIT